uniref:PWWP domain containing 2A n=1 Tax=Nothobranchius kadleci TaxID=1051664 RepID=A0A1A8E6T6_NOTKA
MAAVAAEPGAAAVPTITAATSKDDQPEPGPVGSGQLEFPVEPNGPPELSPGTNIEDGAYGEVRHVRSELEPAAGKASLESGVPVDRSSTERASPGLPANSDSGGTYRSAFSDKHLSAVFLHSLPNPPPVTEAGLSLAEPAEPTTNVTTDRAQATDPKRVYTTLIQAELGPGFVVLDGAAERSEPEPGSLESPAGKEDPPSHSVLQESSGQKPVLDLSPGTEVRVYLDHVIDDALVVSFRLGEQVFSGVLMDVSKRFGPYGIPITTFPRRDVRSRPPESLQPATISGEVSTKLEEVVVTASPSPPHPPQPWTSKPPPLFQEGAPYPPPLFIRDTYNQALPQPLPRKIKRPKRRYRCEEPTSIMNAIKLRPRQVLCDKCKGVVTSGGCREARRGPVELRSNEATRRRRAADIPISSEVKRLRSGNTRSRSSTNRHSSSVIHVSSSSSCRVLRGVASSSTASSSHVRLKLNSKKVLTKGSAADRSKDGQVLQKLTPHCRPASPGKHQDHSKAVTRAAALQIRNQKVHLTRRLQNLSSTAISTHAPLPPRMRLKPQRYRTDEPARQSASASPPKSATSPTQPPPPPVTAPPTAPPSSTASVITETPEDEGVRQRAEWHEAEPPPSSSSLDSSHSECSSTETFDLPPPGDPPSSSSSGPAPLPPSSPSLPPHFPTSSSPVSPTAEDEEEGGDVKRHRKLSTSSSSSSSSSSSVFSKSVSKCLLPDGRTVCVGDIVWAKIYGFPWWPARVLGIMVARRGDTGLAVRQEARVSWFGSPTTSFLPLAQLSPFLETFQLRFDKKRKGPYRRAIAEAASAAKQLTPEVRSLLTQFET